MRAFALIVVCSERVHLNSCLPYSSALPRLSGKKGGRTGAGRLDYLTITLEARCTRTLRVQLFNSNEERIINVL